MSGVYLLQGDDPLFRPFLSGEILILQLAVEPKASNYESKQLEYNRIRKRVQEMGLVNLVFDMSRVTMIDSVVVSMMAGLTSSVRTNSGDAVVVGMSNSLREAIVRLMRLEHQRRRVAWKSFPSVKRAVERFPWNNAAPSS